MSTNTTTPSQRRPLLDLPPEIRNIIYNLVILDPSSSPNHLTISLCPTPFSAAIRPATTSAMTTSSSSSSLTKPSRDKTTTTSSSATEKCLDHWAPPALCRVSTQLRKETLPLHFTHPRQIFRLQIPSFSALTPVLGPLLSNLTLTSLSPDRPETPGFGNGTRSGLRVGRLILDLESHYPLRLSDLVAFVSVWAEFGPLLPVDENIEVACFRGLEARRRFELGAFAHGAFGDGGEGGLNWDENGLIEQRRREFCLFVRDLIALGRRLGVADRAMEKKRQGEGQGKAGGKDEGEGKVERCKRYEDAVREFMFEGETGGFRQFVVWSAIEGLNGVWAEREVD